MTLAALAARRTVPAVLWIAALLLFAWAAGAPGAAGPPATGGRVALPSAGDDRAALAWSALVLLALGTVGHRAARLSRRWRAAESDWLAPRPASRTRIVLAALAGIGAGCLALFGAAGAVGAWTARGAERPAALGPCGVPSVVLAPGERAELPAALPPGSATHLRLGLDLLPGGGARRAADVRARVSRGGTRGREARVRAFGHTLLDVEVPAGSGEAVLELAAGSAPLALTSGSVRALGSAPGRSGPARLAAHALGSALLVGALGLALGTRLRPTLAVLLLASLALASLSEGVGPLAELGRAVADRGAGLVPRPPTPAALGVVLLGVALGAGLAVRGLVPWRDA